MPNQCSDKKQKNSGTRAVDNYCPKNYAKRQHPDPPISPPALPALQSNRVNHDTGKRKNISGLISVWKKTESSGLGPERHSLMQRARDRHREGKAGDADAKP